MVAPADTAPAIAPADSADIETRIEFTDTPLSDIVKETEKVYGVKLTNLPDQSQRLTVSYEGNAQDFVAVLNQLLNADIKIETDIKMEEGSEK